MDPLDSTLKTALAKPITQPYFLVEIGWDAPAYYSTIGTLPWSSKSWLASPLEVRLGQRPQLIFFNEDYNFGLFVKAQRTAGRSVDIYQGDAGDSAHPSPEHIFSGELGPADIDDYVSISCKRYPPIRSPRFYFVPPTFNHVPKNGTKIATPDGTVILEAR